MKSVYFYVKYNIYNCFRNNNITTCMYRENVKKN